MTTRFLKYYSVCFILVIGIAGIILYEVLPDPVEPVVVKEDPLSWYPPGINSLGNDAADLLILYGRELVLNTSKYFGPRGSIKVTSNGMNCANCHIDAGTRNNGFSLSAVAANYPKYRNRSGRVESIEFRINDCFQRSLNGKPIDSAGKEMKAMVSYIRWLGKDVSKNITPRGAGIPKIEILDRAANPDKGKVVFSNLCTKCHGSEGQGQVNPDSTGYTYPPLWGEHSFNISAGMYRISSLAAFIKYNMPYTTVQIDPQLSDEDAWDVAAFISSQQRPVKLFKEDWPKKETKPFDFPFGPYADSFSELQHKYGPFAALKIKKQGP